MTTANPLAYLSEQLEAWRKAGSYQRLHVLESPCEPISRFDGREVINLASNNYLGLADHPKLIEAQVNAARKYGAGSGAVRTISGTMSIHMQLEERIAAFQEDGSVRGISVGLRSECRNCFGDSGPGGSHRFRRAESRQHHRWLPAVESQDSRLPPQRYRPCGGNPEGTGRRY